jgi:transposase-like protein
MECHHCSSASYRKNGTHQGVQRYICKDCGRSFTSRGERFDRSVKEKAIEMYLNNVGIRKVARFTGASPAAVLKWVRAAGKRLADQLQQAATTVASGLPDVIEMDEIYTFVKKNSKGQSFGLLIVGDKVALLPMLSAKESTRP